MPKVSSRKATATDAPKRNATAKKPVVEEEEAEDQPIITVVDKTAKKGVKRKASASVEKNTKKASFSNADAPQLATQEVEDEEIQPPKTMSLKTSDRLSPSGEKANLKLVSWNINGIRAWLANGGLKYIEEEKPDMICFQELKCDKEKIPNDATPAGYKSFWLSGDTAGYSGVGLLTKIDPVDVKYGIGKAEHDTDGRVITAEYEKFYFVVSYIPNSGRKLVRLGYRQEFNEAFRVYLNELDKKKPVVWCGDLNVSHQSIDLANAKSNSKTAGYTQEERDDFTKLLAGGFLDSYGKGLKY